MQSPGLSSGISNAMDTEEPSEVADTPGTLEGDDVEKVDMKKMADDYAKYLIVNSKQDVSS